MHLQIAIIKSKSSIQHAKSGEKCTSMHCATFSPQLFPCFSRLLAKQWCGWFEAYRRPTSDEWNFPIWAVNCLISDDVCRIVWGLIGNYFPGWGEKSTRIFTVAFMLVYRRWHNWIINRYSQLSSADICPTETSSSGPLSMFASSSSMNCRTFSRWFRDTKAARLWSSAAEESTRTKLNLKQLHCHFVFTFGIENLLLAHCYRVFLGVCHLVELLQQPLAGSLLNHSTRKLNSPRIACTIHFTRSHRFFLHLAHSHTFSPKINSEHFWLWHASSSQPLQVTNSFNLSSSTLASQWTHLSERFFDRIFRWLTLL